jgi:hypothetical protein
MTNGIDGIRSDGNAVVSLKTTIQVRPNHNKNIDDLSCRIEDIKILQVIAPHDVIIQNWAQMAADCADKGIYLFRTNY